MRFRRAQDIVSRVIASAERCAERRGLRQGFEDTRPIHHGPGIFRSHEDAEHPEEEAELPDFPRSV